MAGKCTIRMAAFVSVAGVVVPLAAQQVPVPTQPGPTPGQSIPGAPQPPDPNKPPVIPRRVPVPSQPPGAAPQPSPQIAPQAQQAPTQSAPDAGETQGSPTPPAPQRQICPDAINSFGRHDLIEFQSCGPGGNHSHHRATIASDLYHRSRSQRHGDDQQRRAAPSPKISCRCFIKYCA